MDNTFVHAFLQRHRYAVVSTLSPDKSPQSALIGIATTPNLEIIFDTIKTSRKYPNLVAHPRCSVVIGGWDHEQTVQLEGLAFEPSGEALQQYQEIYFAAWPDGPARLTWPGITHLVVRPSWLRYSDFAQNPPQIAEMSFSYDRHRPSTFVIKHIR